MNDGTTIKYYVDGKKIAEKIAANLEGVFDDSLLSDEVIRATTNKTVVLYEYYMRRGNRYYFRGLFTKFSAEIKDLSVLGEIELKRGDKYKLVIT